MDTKNSVWLCEETSYDYSKVHCIKSNELKAIRWLEDMHTEQLTIALEYLEKFGNEINVSKIHHDKETNKSWIDSEGEIWSIREVEVD